MRTKIVTLSVFLGLLPVIPQSVSADEECPKALEELVVQAPDGDVFQKLWLKYASKKDGYSKLPRFSTHLSAKFSKPSYVTNTGIRIPPDAGVCSEIIKNLNKYLTAAAQKKFQFTPTDRQFLEAIKKEALRQQGSKTVSYDDYINLAFYFSIAMNLKSYREPDRWSAEQKRILDIEPSLIDAKLPKGKWWPELKRMVEQAPRFLYIPTFRDLSKQDQNALRPYPIYYLGLTTEPFVIPDFPNQYLFFTHDVVHSAFQSEADYADMKRFGGSPVAWLQSRLAFSQAFDSEVAKVEDETLQKTIQEGWYEIFHENPRDTFNLAGLKEGLTRDHPPELLLLDAHALEGKSEAQRKKISTQAIQWLNDFAAKVAARKPH